MALLKEESAIIVQMAKKYQFKAPRWPFFVTCKTPKICIIMAITKNESAIIKVYFPLNRAPRLQAEAFRQFLQVAADKKRPVTGQNNADGYAHGDHV